MSKQEFMRTDYFRALPLNIQESIVQSAPALMSIRELHRMSQNLMEGARPAPSDPKVLDQQ